MAHQLIITVEDSKVLATIKKMLCLIDGVRITTPRTQAVSKTKSGLELAQENIDAGRLNTYNSADEMFAKLGI